MNKEKLVAYIKAVWPTVYRIVNGTFYLIIHVIRSIVIGTINQFKGRM